jgi:hypothetical protein
MPGAGYFQKDLTLPVSSAQPVKLVVFPIGHHLIVYASLPGSGYSQRQLVFESERFNVAQPLSPAVLRSTYCEVRDKLFTWAVNACLLKDGKQQIHGLMALQEEALYKIVANLHFREVAVVATVCKRLAAVASDSSVWKQLYKQEFLKDLEDSQVRILQHMYRLQGFGLVSFTVSPTATNDRLLVSTTCDIESDSTTQEQDALLS